MIEYWLQKKLIGGWSPVTWYDTLEQAMENYQKCIPNVSYGWRICKVEVVEQQLPLDPIEVVAPNDDIEPVRKAPVKVLTNPKPQVEDGWGSFKAPVEFTEEVVEVKEHGLSGSVWMIHHERHEKVRVPGSELDAYLAQGYERGGPRTQFRG